jgi:hypothetical protein
VGLGRVDTAVGDAALADDLEAEEGDALFGDDLAAGAVPRGVGVGALAERPAQGLEPGRVDAGGRAGEEARRPDDLGRDDPAGGLAEKDRAGPERDFAVLGPGINIFFFMGGDVREIAAEDRPVDRAV